MEWERPRFPPPRLHAPCPARGACWLQSVTYTDTSRSPRVQNRHQHQPWCCSFYGFGQTYTPLQYHRVASVPRQSSALHQFILPRALPATVRSLSPWLCRFQKAMGLELYCTQPLSVGLFHPSLSPVDLFLISPVSRLQMRTPRHSELRRPVQCRTDGKWQSSDSSPGLPAPGDAPGSRAHCGHPGTNHAPPKPVLEARPRASRPPSGEGESGPSSHLGPEARSPVPGHWAGRQRQQAQASLHSPWPQSSTP